MHLMFDLETWGTAPGSALRSIGAVVFDMQTGETGEEFYCNIESGTKWDGLVRDPSTEAWWAKQSKAAQKALEVDKVPLYDATQRFDRFCAKNGVTRWWSQGANFDPVLWEAACKAIKTRVPWKYYQCRDTRTLYDLAEFNTDTIEREGTYHNALDDCKHQVKCVVAAYRQFVAFASI